MKYIAYCRKSTDERDKQVLSIKQQIAELKEFAFRQHIEIAEFIEESKTAKVPGREKFNLLLKRVEKGEASGIISWHPDRLARNSIDAGKVIYLLDTFKLQDLKFPHFWFENTPQGKYNLNMAFCQSKYYVDNLSENVTRGMMYKVKHGIWPVKAPYGYINDSRTRGIHLDSKRSKIIKKAFELFSKGGKSFTDIARHLHQYKISTISRKGNKKSKKPLKPDQVRWILSNKFYIGIMKYAGEYYQGTHKLFISKQLFDKVQKQIKLAERPTRVGKHDFAFTKLIKCGECGASITAEKKTKFYRVTNRTAHYTYYRCTKKIKPCKQRPITEENLIPLIRQVIDDVALPQEYAKNWYQWLNEDEILEKQNSEQNLQRLDKELEDVEEKLNRLLDTYLDQVIDTEIYKKKKNELFDLKLKINEEIDKTNTGGSSWLEPFREWISEAESIAKIARAKNTCHDLKEMAKTVGSDLLLYDRQLKVTYNQGFAELRDRLAPHSQSLGLPTLTIQVDLYRKLRTSFRGR